MDLVIRKALKEDLPVILNIQKRAFIVQAELYDAYDIPPMIETIEDIDLSSEKLIVLVAEVDGTIVGSIRVVFGEEEAEIKRLSVIDKFQGRGIGRKLLSEAEKNCGGVSRIWLFTGGQSYENINLYKKAGYRPFKEEHWKDNFTLIYLDKIL